LQLTDEELALLLAHEVAHIMAGHPSEKLSFMAHRLGKDRAPTAGSALQAFYTHDGYARQFQPTARLQEREADAIGAALLARSGYDAQRALNVFDKLAQIENGTFVEDATHDPATTRKKAISEVLRASMGLLPVSN
jgi:predicted Zn-dependent protease